MGASCWQCVTRVSARQSHAHLLSLTLQAALRESGRSRERGKVKDWTGRVSERCGGGISCLLSPSDCPWCRSRRRTHGHTHMHMFSDTLREGALFDSVAQPLTCGAGPPFLSPGAAASSLASASCRLPATSRRRSRGGRRGSAHCHFLARPCALPSCSGAPRGSTW